jgi:uncharacterized protein YciI
MLFAVLFTDNADRAGERPRLLPEHLDFLAANSAAVLAAGPLLEGTEGAGGLWLVEAADPAAARALVEADPFWPSGLRQSVRILAWRQVFADGKRLI